MEVRFYFVVIALSLFFSDVHGQSENDGTFESAFGLFENSDDKKHNLSSDIEDFGGRPSEMGMKFDDISEKDENEPDFQKELEKSEELSFPEDTIANPDEEPIKKRIEIGSRMAARIVYYDSDDPEADRWAPTRDSSPPNYAITQERLAEIRSKFMYWYFDKGGDDGNGDYQTDIHSSTSQLHKNLNFYLPFYGFRYNYTRVSRNGYLEFSDPPGRLEYPLIFPIKEWPKMKDPAFIGIFYSKCRIGNVRPTDKDQRTPGVYFRLERDLQGRTDQFGVEMRERLTWDIREAVVGADVFNPKHAIIVTWKNMSLTGGNSHSLYKTNTFQLIVATDEVTTYVMFNYLNIQWLSHTEAGGSPTGGEGGTPAFVGFNAGNGTRSYSYYPYSQEMTLRDLTSRGWANNFPGRHIFRIDENIMLGTCNKDTSGTELPLIFAPESGNMLGGTVVNITGPCFNPDDRVRCRFGTNSEEVIGKVINRNRVLCVQPYIHGEGYVRLMISINGGSYNWKGNYFVETPATASEKIFFEGRSIHEVNPAEIKMTWNRYNLTSNWNAGIQISLWGYRERTIRPELEFITILEDGLTNTGSFVITPSNYRNRNNPEFVDMTFGFIQINLTQPAQYSGLNLSPTIWSRPIPLAWYFSPQWERIHGKYWGYERCNTWLKNDRYLKNFAADISICPCTLKHALIDKGRFLPDFDCDKDINPDCYYNKGARHCVKTGVPNLGGSEQQCCYDRNDYLMLTYDQMWGSRPRRSHNLGISPWDQSSKVPSLSYWYHDMAPLYTCCLWQDENSVGCQTHRFEMRASQDCVGYQSPAIASVFGDPHIITFDDLEYTFNGKGEFVLVRVHDEKDKLDIQGRFEQLGNSINGEVKATTLTAVAARGNNSATIEVRMRPPQAQWRYRLDVFANGRRVYFDRPYHKFQHFSGVIVYTPTYVLNQSEVVIMFDTGVGIEVFERQGFMSARVLLPWSYMNKTRGLMGNWSTDKTDDFTTPDGSVFGIPNLNNFETLHKNFAIKWLLEDKESKSIGLSLFTREQNRSPSHYANRSFVPEFKREPQDILNPYNMSTHIENAVALCGDCYQCQYDYANSLNRDMAVLTKITYDEHKEIKTTHADEVISCGVLPTPRFGRKSTFLFVPDTEVVFECDQDFILIGDYRRTCLPQGRWDYPEYGYTECLLLQEYSSRQGGITAGIVIGCLIPVLLVAVIIAFIIMQRRRDDEDFEDFHRTRKTEMEKMTRSEPRLAEERTPSPSKSTDIN